VCKQNTPLNCAFDKMITKIIIYYFNSVLCTLVPVGCKICIYSIHVQCYTDSDSQQHTAQRWTGVCHYTYIPNDSATVIVCYHGRKTLTTQTERLG
jgi:hypothetical protein